MLSLSLLLLTQGFENQRDKIVGQKGFVFGQIVRYEVVVVQTYWKVQPRNNHHLNLSLNFTKYVAPICTNYVYTR